MPMVSLKLMAGAARSMVVASARMTAAENPPRFSRAMRCARTVRGEDSVGVNVNTTQAGATTLLLPAQVVCRALKNTGGAGTLKGTHSYSLPPPIRKHHNKKLRQAKVPWGSKKTAHG